MVIPESDYQIDIAPLIYDYIILALPIQKIHGKAGNKPAKCNSETLKHLDNHEEKNEIDPRWEALKNIKLDNNN